MFEKKRVCVAVGLAVALGGLAAVPAAAQQGDADKRQADEKQLETVVITGSRLVRQNLESTTPVFTIDPEMLRNAGTQNIADIVTQLPQFAPSFGASRTQSTFSEVDTSGLNLANLRNLGSVRTLVLINGRRVPGGTSTSTNVDFNTIPTANIERIEVITGGAAAVYGADAVAGVINIITKKNFEGIQVGGGYGSSFEGDNENPNASLLLGGRLGGLRGMLTLQYDEQGRVSCKDRYICAEDFFWTQPGTQLRGPAAYSAVGLAGRFLIGSTFYTRRAGSFVDANGQPIPFSTPIDGFNRNAQRDIAIPTTRTMAAAEGSIDITRSIKAFAELNYGKTEIKSESEGHPFQSDQPGNLFGTQNLNIPINNPFIPAPLRALLPTTQTSIPWQQRFSGDTVGGPRGATSERETTRGMAGVRGEFDKLFGLGSDWRWEISHVYGKTDVSLGTNGLVSTEAVFNGLRVEPDPANPGQFRCVDAAARAAGCVPINPFAPYTADMSRYMVRSAVTNGSSKLNSTLAFVSGNPLELPAGLVNAVVGAESRSFGGGLDYDFKINQGLTTGNQIGDVESVTTRTREFFAEVLVPIVSNKPLARFINLEGAYRQSSPSRGDNYNTQKLGAEWSPAAELRFRLMTAKAVRTPVPGELSGVGQTFGVVNDPCTAARRNLNPVRAANCDADGVPATYAPPQNVEQSVAGLIGGNANLTPETGRTLTYGFVWTPARNISFSLDRFEIKIDDIIRRVPRQDAVNACYDTPNRILCDQVRRGTNSSIPGATWVLTSVNGQLQNAALQVIRGFDVEGRYAFAPTRFGAFELSAFATIYDQAVVSILDGRSRLELLGFAGGSTEDQGFIRVTGATNLGWRHGKLSGNWNVRYIGRASMSPSAKELGFPRVPEHVYHNVRMSYGFGKDAEVFGGITNLFDKNPPFFASGFSGTQALDTIPGYYDVFGRSFFLGARYRF